MKQNNDENPRRYNRIDLEYLELPEEVVLAEGYSSEEDIVEKIVETCAKTQNCTVDELETVPVTAVDEGEMPKAIKNSGEISQGSWDKMRSLICIEIEEGGYTIDGQY